MTNEPEFQEIACPTCNKRLKVPSRLSGKKVKCPSCEGSIKVPGSAPLSLDDDWLNLDAPAVDPGNFQTEAKEPKGTHSWENRKKGPAAAPSMPKFEEPQRASPPVTSKGSAPSKGSAASQASTVSKDPATSKGTTTSKEPAVSKGNEASVPAKPVAEKPVTPKSSSFDDDDFPALAPEEPRKAAAWSFDLDPNDDPFAQEGAKSKQAPPAAQKPLVEEFNEEEIRVKCRICGSISYVFESQIGTKIKCIDCHSDFVVPPPAPGSKKSKVKPTLDSGGNDLQLSRELPSQLPSAQIVERNVADVLQRAERELDEEEVEDRTDVYDFDATGWLRRTFGFLFDPGLLAIALGTGCLLACILYMGGVLASMSEKSKGISVVLQVILFSVGGVPIIGASLANGLAILQSSANRIKRVREWPIFNPGDWFEESLIVIVAFILAMLPGATVGGLLQNMGHAASLTAALMILSSWILFPLFLLSMLDNQSLFQPVSSDVFQSLSKRVDAWGGFYLVSAIGAFGLFLMVVFAISQHGAGLILVGLAFPLLLFFLFHQLGILASAISDVTGLGFETNET